MALQGSLRSGFCTSDGWVAGIGELCTWSWPEPFECRRNGWTWKPRHQSVAVPGQPWLRGLESVIRSALHTQSFLSQGCRMEGHPHPYSDVAGFVLDLWWFRVCLWPHHGPMCYILVAFPSQHVVQYLQALKTIGWDEYALSSFFQVQTGVPVATVSAGSLFAISRYSIAGQKLSMAQIKEALYTPVRKVTPQVFSPVKEVRRYLI